MFYMATLLKIVLVAVLASGIEAVTWSRVELSTCDVPMYGFRLSLCCYTENIPKEASIVFYTKTGDETFDAFYRIKPSCVPIEIYPNELQVLSSGCNKDGSRTIYNVTVSVSNAQTIFENTWGCGFYGNFSSLAFTKNQVLTRYHGSHLLVENDKVVLTWILDNPLLRPITDLDIYKPNGDRIAHVSGQNVVYYAEGFSATGNVSSGQIDLLVTNVSRQSNGTYVCVYTDARTLDSRDGVTLVLLAQPKTPELTASEPTLSGNRVSGHMYCNSTSQSAAPLYYKPTLDYVWIVPYHLDDPNFSRVTNGNGSIYFPEINCAAVTSLPVYCQAREGNLTSFYSNPMNLSSFCVIEEATKKYNPTITVLVVFLFITVFLLVTVLSVTVVVGRRFFLKKGRRCCRLSSSDSDSDLESVLHRSRDEEREDRRRQISNMMRNIEGNDNPIGLEDGLARRNQERAEERAVQEAIENIAIEDSRQIQLNQLALEPPMIDVHDGGVRGDMDIDLSALGAVGGMPLPRSTPTLDDDRNNLAVVESLLEEHNRHLSQKVVQLDINRENIVQHILQLYSNPELAVSRVTIKMTGEDGHDCGGVADDMYTTFWYRIQEQYFQGYEAVVPYLPINRWGTEEAYYRVLGRILSHTVALTKALPIPMCKSAFIVMIYDTTNVDKQAVLEDFLSFLDPIDRHLVTAGINNFDSLITEQINEIQTIFARFEYPAVIRKENFNDHLTQLARNIVCVRPKPLLDLMRAGMPEPHFEHFWSMLTIGYIEILFRALRPNPSRVVARLKTDPTEERLTQRQKRAFRYLQDFIKELSQPEIETFLHFLTGKKTTPRQALVVCFTKESGFQRAPKAHTCSNMLELPETYENYQTFKSEFKHLLAADEAMTMTMA